MPLTKSRELPRPTAPSFCRWLWGDPRETEMTTDLNVEIISKFKGP